MRRRNIVVRNTVLSVEVDPVLAIDELFVDVGEPVVSGVRTRKMDEQLLASALLGAVVKYEKAKR